QTFSKAILVADFYACQNYVAKNLCVNRDRLVLSCGIYRAPEIVSNSRQAVAIRTVEYCTPRDPRVAGQCQLNKRLQEENKENSNSTGREDNRFEVLSSRSFYLTSFQLYQSEIVRDYPLAVVTFPIDRPATIFHPPGWSFRTLTFIG